MGHPISRRCPLSTTETVDKVSEAGLNFVIRRASTYLDSLGNSYFYRRIIVQSVQRLRITLHNGPCCVGASPRFRRRSQGDPLSEILCYFWTLADGRVPGAQVNVAVCRKVSFYAIFMVEFYLHCPLHNQGVMLNLLSPRIILLCIYG
jgi:hypothetical protein